MSQSNLTLKYLDVRSGPQQIHVRIRSIILTASIEPRYLYVPLVP